MGLLKDKIKQTEKEKQAINHFVSEGYTPEQASGLVGNLIAESGLNTTAEGDKTLPDRAYGIAQWRGSRFNELKKQYPGEAWKDFNNQLKFVSWELNNTERKAGEILRTTKNPLAAGQAVSDAYERPKLKFYENPERQKAVLSVYQSHVDPNYTYEIKGTKRNNQEEIDAAGNQIRETLMNFDILQTKTNLATSEVVEPKETEPKEVVEAKAQIQEKSAEEQFLENYLNEQAQEQPIQLAQQEQQQAPLKSISQSFNEISQFVDNPFLQQGGQMPVSPNGMYEFPMQRVVVPTNGNITMNNINHKIKGISLETGEEKIMYPDLQYFFNNTKNVLEIPI